jgi:hypothetical protein
MEHSDPSHDNSRGYVDPCSENYDENLARKDCGTIISKTPLGAYIKHKLKLYALKHRYLWLLDIAHHQCENVGEFLQEADETDPEIIELKDKYAELALHYFNYHKIIRENK